MLIPWTQRRVWLVPPRPTHSGDAKQGGTVDYDTILHPDLRPPRLLDLRVRLHHGGQTVSVLDFIILLSIFLVAQQLYRPVCVFIFIFILFSFFLCPQKSQTNSQIKLDKNK